MFKFHIGQTVIISDNRGIILDRQMYDGEAEYLVKPEFDSFNCFEGQGDCPANADQGRCRCSGWYRDYNIELPKLTIVKD